MALFILSAAIFVGMIIFGINKKKKSLWVTGLILLLLAIGLFIFLLNYPEY